MGLNIEVGGPAKRFEDLSPEEEAVAASSVGAPYSAFGRFRVRLAAEEGFDLLEMEGFRGTRSWDEISSPLKPLLDHSDCDGVLTWRECARVEPRLREIVEAWDEDFGGQRAFGVGLCAKMRLVVERRGRLEFH